jgi:hypothetical protein
MNTWRVLSAILFATPLTACTCDNTALEKQQPMPSLKLDAGMQADAQPQVTTIPDAMPVDTGPQARFLAFVGTSPVNMHPMDVQEMGFRLTQSDGTAVPGVTVSFMLSGTQGMIDQQSATTDATGYASTHFTATAPGQIVLTASAELADPATVTINIVQNTADLIVDVVSQTRITVGAADALVYVAPMGQAPTCAQLLGTNTPPQPTASAMYPTVPGSQTFPGQMANNTVTVIATGTSTHGTTIARGCSEGTQIVGGVTAHVTVTLGQLPTSFNGDYDTLLNLDLGSTLPPPYGPIIDTIGAVLSDPAGWAIYETLLQVDNNLGFTFLQWTPPGQMTPVEASFDDVEANQSSFGAWLIARNWLDNLLRTQLGMPYIQVTEVGADIGHAIRRFDVGARYTITATLAQANPMNERVQVTESWRALVFQWQLNCPVGDMGCARRPIELSGANANLAPASATYGANITWAPQTNAPMQTERFHVALDSHRIDLRYGAIILLVLDNIVFPSLPGGLASNSLNGVLLNLVQCNSVAAAINNATGIPTNIIAGICTGAVNAAAQGLQNLLLSVDSMNNPGLVGGLSPTGGGSFYLVDGDHDLVTERVEQLSTTIAWTTTGGTTGPTTTVIGQGRRAASGCTRDQDCASPLVCTPIPSYLEVRELERDCRRPVGAMPGEMTCTTNADCASNLCFPTSLGHSVCYAACTASGGTCSAGSCVDNAASVNLNPVLSGLGNATTAACVP